MTLKSVATIVLLVFFPSVAAAQVVIDNKQPKEVGVKEVRLREKMATPELIRQKHEVIAAIEQKYNRDISAIVTRLCSPASRLEVTTHLDVDLFDTDFNEKVRSSRNLTVSIILSEDAAQWAWGSDAPRKIEELKAILSSTFRIPAENISIITAQ